MSRKEFIVEILKSEYGIETPDQLWDRISKLGPLDLSPFCAEILGLRLCVPASVRCHRQDCF